MSEHRYKLGQSVTILAGIGIRDGEARIVRLLPEGGGQQEPQYRVKIGTENHERVVMESGIEPAK